MDNNDLNKISASFSELLSFIQLNMINESYLIKNCSDYLKNLQNCFEKSPLPPSHMKVIFYLAKEKSAPISQISKTLGISKPNMTPIIDRLINYELVNRYTDPKDRRVIRVELTSKAYDLFNDFQKYFQDSLTKKISLLSEDDLSTLSESLINLHTILKKLY